MTQNNSSSALFYAESINSGRWVLQDISLPSFFLDFALDESFLIDDELLKAGCWRLSHCSAGIRKIKNRGKNSGDFCSFPLHENPYMTLPEIGKNGYLIKEMAFPLLKLIFGATEINFDPDKNIWIQLYSQLLVSQLERETFIRFPVRFTYLKIIYRSVERLQLVSSNFPSAKKIMLRSGIKIPLFQKGCRAIYGESLHHIIQHLKMKEGLEKIIKIPGKIKSVGSMLGYQYPDNFITAFHRYFGITPMQIFQINHE